MSRERADSHGVTLSTESERNVALYRHLGYRVVGQATIAPGLETWDFFRPDPLAGGASGWDVSPTGPRGHRLDRPGRARAARRAPKSARMLR